MSREFVSQLATRVARLQKFADILDRTALDLLVANTQRLQEEYLQRCQTDSETTFLRDEVPSCSSDELKVLQQAKNSLRAEVESSLADLKCARNVNCAQEKSEFHSFPASQEERGEFKVPGHSYETLQTELQSLQLTVQGFQRQIDHTEECVTLQTLEAGDFNERLHRLESAVSHLKSAAQRQSACTCIAF